MPETNTFDGRRATYRPLTFDDLQMPTTGGTARDLSEGRTILPQWMWIEIGGGMGVVGWVTDGYLFAPKDEQSGIAYYHPEGPTPTTVSEPDKAVVTTLDAVARRERAAQWRDLITGQSATTRTSAPLAVSQTGPIQEGPLTNPEYRRHTWYRKRGQNA